MNNTKIEWCDLTLNPIVGCTYGCSYCYAARLNKRFKWIDTWAEPQFFPERLKQLDSIKKSKNIFMNSMSDIADWRYFGGNACQQILQAIRKNNQHNYLFLTKRPKQARIIEFNEQNIWLGTTVNYNYECKNIIDLITNTNNSNLFVSFEPVFEGLDMLKQIINYIDKISWFIIGAETGNRKEKIIPAKEWIETIVYIAYEYHIPVFMKDSLITIVGKENMIREFPKQLKQ